jgi:hypothetical protein
MRILVLVLMLMASCQSPRPSYGLQKRPVDEVYHGAGISKYFLAGLPLWANFSTDAACRRKKQVRFLNFENLSKSYGFKYEELIQFQLMLNSRLESFIAGHDLEVMRPKDESYIFFNVQDQIKGGAKDFLKSEYKQSYIILVDEALNDTKKYAALKRFLASDQINNAVPYLVSVCMTKSEMEEFVHNKLKKQEGLKMITAEMFSPYKDKTQLGTSFYLDVEMFFGKDYELTVVTTEDVPKYILGKVKVKQIK